MTKTCGIIVPTTAEKKLLLRLRSLANGAYHIVFVKEGDEPTALIVLTPESGRKVEKLAATTE